MKQWFGKALQICGFTVLALLPAAQCDAVLVSVKALGMADAGIAYPQDSLASALNPALGVDVGNRLDIGATWLQQNGEATIYGNTFTNGTFPPGAGTNGTHHSSHHRNTVTPDFGVNVMVCGSCDFSVGVVAYNKGYVQSDYSHPVPIFGTSRPGIESIQEVVAPCAALRFDCHQIGIALQLCGQRFKARGIENFDRAAVSVAPSHVTNRNADHSFGLGVVFGYAWHAYPGVTIGLTYEPKTHMSRLHSYSGFLENGGRLDYPERFGAGLGLDLMCNLHAALDFQWIRWKSVGSLGNKAPSRVLDLVSNRLGSKGGPGFGWRDQPFVRFGLDYDLCDYGVTVRAGYRWSRAPIRSNVTTVNALTLDIVENVFTVGASWAPCNNNEISVFYGHGFNKKIKGTQSIDPAAPPVGLGGGYVDLENSLNAAGISWGVTF